MDDLVKRQGCINAGRGLAVIALLALAGCGGRTACVDGELYSDFDGNGIFVREAHDSGKTPIKCVEGRALQDRKP